jgi:hypothetical protein
MKPTEEMGDRSWLGSEIIPRNNSSGQDSALANSYILTYLFARLTYIPDEGSSKHL